MTTSTTAAVRGNRNHLGLLGAASLPTGGFLAVDLFQPHQPVYLFVNSDERADGSVERIVRAMESPESTLQLSGLALPAHWVRIAVVAGVTRWLDLPINESLLAADRALALWAADDSEAAGELFRRWDVEGAIERLADRLGYLNATAGDAPSTVALREEFVRVVEAGAACGADRYADALSRATRHTADFAEVPLGGDLSASTLEGFLSTPASPGFGVAMQDVDRLHVPARTVANSRAGLVVDSEADTVTIFASKYRSVGRESTAGSRLLARLHDRDTGFIIALGSLELVDDDEEPRFEATLPLRGRDPSTVEIDVYDGAGLSSPRAGRDGRAQRAALAAAQDAFSYLRRARADNALGFADDARALRTRATERLSSVENDDWIREGGEFGAGLATIAARYASELVDALTGGSDVARPLLCELEAEHRRLSDR